MGYQKSPGHSNHFYLAHKRIQQFTGQFHLAAQLRRTHHPQSRREEWNKFTCTSKPTQPTGRQTAKTPAEEITIAHEVQAIAKYGPKIKPTVPMLEDEFIEQLIEGTNQSRGSLLATLSEIKTICEIAIK